MAFGGDPDEKMVLDYRLDMRVISWFDSSGSWIISGKLLG